MDDLPPVDLTVTTPDPHNTFSHRLALILMVPLSILFVALLTLLFGLNTTAYVEGKSMEPTLLDGELVLVSRGYDEPQRGDIVVVALDGNEGDGIVKRIVALPGDEIQVTEGEAQINGESEKGDYTVYIACCDLSVPLQTVPEGQVFLLGDNRPISEDSRVFGTVPLTDIRGQVVAVLQPITEARRVD